MFQGSPSMLAQSSGVGGASPGGCEPVSLPPLDLQPVNVGVWPTPGHLERRSTLIQRLRGA